MQDYSSNSGFSFDNHIQWMTLTGILFFKRKSNNNVKAVLGSNKLLYCNTVKENKVELKTICRQTDTQTERRQKHTDTERQKQTEIETDRETDKHLAEYEKWIL